MFFVQMMMHVTQLGVIVDEKTTNRKNFCKKGVDLIGKTGIPLSGDARIPLLLAETSADLISLVVVVCFSFVGRISQVKASKTKEWRV
jgi:hypothetical protein